MSSSLKDLQCIAVHTDEDRSETTAVLRRQAAELPHLSTKKRTMLAVLCCSRAPQAVLQGETPECTGEARCSTVWSMASAG